MSDEKKTTFSVRCKNASCVGGRIEVSIFSDSGYSNWTVMDSGAVEFKCHGCGKFASTDEWKKPNEPENFEVTCGSCGSEDNWDYQIGDVDGEMEGGSHIECKDCHARQSGDDHA